MKVWGIHRWDEWGEETCGASHIFDSYEKARLYCIKKAYEDNLEEASFGDYWGDDRHGYLIEEFVVE